MERQSDCLHLQRQRERCVNRMQEIDNQPAEIRHLVHEFNWSMVKSFLDCGVRNAKHIRHLIQIVQRGSDAYGVGRPKGNGVHLSTAAALDLAGRKDLVLTFREPTSAMIKASMDAVPPYNPSAGVPLLSKPEKHLRRLRAALEAGDAIST